MIVKYTPADPADGEPNEWKFNPRRVKASVCVVVEKLSGKSYDEWREAVIEGDTLAKRVLLWLLICRDAPIRFEDTPDFYFDELAIIADLDELREMRDQAAAAHLKPGVSEDHRTEILTTLDQEIARLTDAEADVEAPGKAG